MMEVGNVECRVNLLLCSAFKEPTAYWEKAICLKEDFFPSMDSKQTCITAYWVYPNVFTMLPFLNRENHRIHLCWNFTSSNFHILLKTVQLQFFFTFLQPFSDILSGATRENWEVCKFSCLQVDIMVGQGTSYLCTNVCPLTFLQNYLPFLVPGQPMKPVGHSMCLFT